MIESTEHVTYIISFIGSENADLPYYLAKCLDGYGKTVLVLDNTRYGDAYYTQKRPDFVPQQAQEDAIQVKGITYHRNIAYSHRAFQCYDYVFILHGEYFEPSYLDNKISDMIYLVSDFEPKHIRYIKSHFMEEKEEKKYKVTLILKDMMNEKVSAKTIIKSLQANTCFDIEKHYVIPFDETDKKMYQSLSYNGTQKLKHLSSDYKDVLADIVSFMTGQENDVKKIKKYISTL